MDEARKRSKLLDGYEGPLTGEDQKISVLQQLNALSDADVKQSVDDLLFSLKGYLTSQMQEDYRTTSHYKDMAKKGKKVKRIRDFINEVHKVVLDR